MLCDEGDHDQCSHRLGGSGSIWKSHIPKALLCRCVCHGECPATGQAVETEHWLEVPDVVWIQVCTCPGAPEERQWRTEFAEEEAERKRKTDQIFASIDVSIVRSRSDFRLDLQRAYEEWEVEPHPYELDSLSGALEIKSDPGHHPVARIVGIFARMATDLVRDIRSGRYA
jgi:hypothetical protein